jgi:hypothetical protein
MIRRRAAATGIGTKLGNHSFRATGITAYLKSGGTLEKAGAMANHASTRTTQLYDRRRDEVSLDEVERFEMPTSIYIDNNVWDFLFERGIDLSVELPRNEYYLFLTREAEFEIPPIQKGALKAFIEKSIKDCCIETRSLFGFYDQNHPPDEQRVGGWNEGYWAEQGGIGVHRAAKG